MTIEWFLILLPVVFLLGWFSARLDIRHIRKTAGALPSAYLRGLSHLLRGEKNLALDCFLQAQPLDPESIELQFAIGELSRNRGDYRRALKAHETICENESLPAEDRMRARWELACDYSDMGFFDLAEKHAILLCDDAGYEERAGGMLLEIRQRAHDYQRAVDILKKMPANALLMRRQTHAHLLCECAMQLSSTHHDEKRSLLNSALEADGRCVRANLLLGDIASEQKDFAAAAQYYLTAAQQNSDYLFLVAPRFLAAQEAQNNIEEGREKILNWLRESPSAVLFNAIYSDLAARGMAAELSTESVLRGLGPAAATMWADEQLRTSSDAERDFWHSLKKTFATIHWKCETCGYQSDEFTWQCHNCLAWESLHAANKI